MSDYYYNNNRDMVNGGDWYQIAVIGGTLLVALVCLAVAGFLIYYFFVRQYVDRYGARSRAGSRMGTNNRSNYPPPPRQQQYQMQPIQSVMQPGDIYKPPMEQQYPQHQPQIQPQYQPTPQQQQQQTPVGYMEQPPQRITPTGVSTPLDYTDQRSSWPVFSNQQGGQANMSTSSMQQYQMEAPVSMPPPPLTGAPPTYTMQSYQAPNHNSTTSPSSLTQPFTYYQSPAMSNQNNDQMTTTYRTTTTTTQKSLMANFSAV